MEYICPFRDEAKDVTVLFLMEKFSGCLMMRKNRRISDCYIMSLYGLLQTNYAWEDYDSVCSAFYLGLYYLEDVLWKEKDKREI